MRHSEQEAVRLGDCTISIHSARKVEIPVELSRRVKASACFRPPFRMIVGEHEAPLAPLAGFVWYGPPPRPRRKPRLQSRGTAWSTNRLTASATCKPAGSDARQHGHRHQGRHSPLRRAHPSRLSAIRSGVDCGATMPRRRRVGIRGYRPSPSNRVCWFLSTDGRSTPRRRARELGPSIPGRMMQTPSDRSDSRTALGAGRPQRVRA